MVMTIRWFTLMALLMSATLAQGQTQELRLVTRMMPPLVVTQQGQLSGFSIDLWNSIAQRIQARTKYHIAPDVGALLDEVQSGKADVGIADSHSGNPSQLRTVLIIISPERVASFALERLLDNQPARQLDQLVLR